MENYELPISSLYTKYTTLQIYLSIQIVNFIISNEYQGVTTIAKHNVLFFKYAGILA